MALIYRRAHGVAMSWCHDVDRSFDFVQEMFLNVWRRWIRTSDQEIWSWPYCKTTLIRIIQTEWRRPKVVVVLDEDDHLADQAIDDGQHDWAMLVSDKTQRVLDRLTERQRQVIEAIVFHGLTPEETANRLKLDRQSVYDYRRKALIKLSKELSGSP